MQLIRNMLALLPHFWYHQGRTGSERPSSPHLPSVESPPISPGLLFKVLTSPNPSVKPVATSPYSHQILGLLMTGTKKSTGVQSSDTCQMLGVPDIQGYSYLRKAWIPRVPITREKKNFFSFIIYMR